MNYALNRTTDHVKKGLTLFIDQFKNKPRIAAWARAYLRQTQLLEDAAFDTLISRLIDNATGIQLDVLGRVVGEKRLGRADDLYRVFIRARVRINRSQGNTQDLLDVLAMITETPLSYVEYPPAYTSIEFYEITDQDPVLLLSMLRDTKAAGVGMSMVVPTTALATRFIMKTFDGADTANQGFGHAGHNPGGEEGAISIPGSVRLTDANADFPASIVGKQLYVKKATNALNVGKFAITARPSATEIEYTNANAVVQAGATVEWQVYDETFGLLSDAVTIRDPNAELIPPAPSFPAIDYITPATGPEVGGASVTIKGRGFSDVTAVRFGSTNGPSNFTDIVVVDQETITAKTPPYDSGDRTPAIRVTTPRGTGVRVNAYEYDVAPFLHVTSMTPGSGHWTGGTTVTIAGEKFTGVDQVELLLAGDPGEATAMASFTVDDDNTITAITPSGTRFAPYTLRLRNNTTGEETIFGTSPYGSIWSYLDDPHVSFESITPDHGSWLGGYTCTIKGSGFVDVGLADIEVNGLAPVAFTVVDDETATFVMPDTPTLFVDPYTSYGGRPEGNVEIFGYDGASPVTSVNFQFEKLHLHSAVPSSSPRSGGTTVQLVGTALDTLTEVHVQDDNNIIDHDASGTLTIIDAEHAEFTFPAVAADAYGRITVVGQDPGNGFVEGGGDPFYTAYAFQFVLDHEMT